MWRQREVALFLKIVPLYLIGRKHLRFLDFARNDKIAELTRP